MFFLPLIPRLDDLFLNDLDRCGALIDEAGLHALLCRAGPARFRAHKALILALTRELQRVGAFVDVERNCPQLYKKLSDGSWQEARLDLVVRFAGTLQDMPH